MEEIEIVNIGIDPFGRGEATVFYRNYSIGDGKEIFYLWVIYWPKDWPTLSAIN